MLNGWMGWDGWCLSQRRGGGDRPWAMVGFLSSLSHFCTPLFKFIFLFSSSAHRTHTHSTFAPRPTDTRFPSSCVNTSPKKNDLPHNYYCHQNSNKVNIASTLHSQILFSERQTLACLCFRETLGIGRPRIFTPKQFQGEGRTAQGQHLPSPFRGQHRFVWVHGSQLEGSVRACIE